jgi:L-aminopeptidase/D-esterase-like protein
LKSVVPTVCGAVIYDLNCGKDLRPDAEMGYRACLGEYKDGAYGAGIGATFGKIREELKQGGIGGVCLQYDELLVGCVVVVNSIGEVARNGLSKSEKLILENYKNKDFIRGSNTIIGCIMTNADLNKQDLTRIAMHGQNGIARTVRPAHTICDGDVIFAMSSGKISASQDAVGILAALSVEKAIWKAVAFC